MIVEEKIISVGNISQCTTSQAIMGSLEEKQVNVNVTTCFESEGEEGIFDETFDLSFE